MKRDTLRLSQHQFIETYRDGPNGRVFIAYSQGASVFIRDLKELRRFLKIPKSIPMRESLESWLVSLEDMDQKRSAARDLPAAEPQYKKDSVAGLSPELLATGWGPEVHLATEAEPIDSLIDNDPTANTRMIT